MINLFLVAGVKHLMVTHLSNTLNTWILLRKTWMATENCFHEKLLKAKQTTSKDFLRYFFCKDTNNLSKPVLNMLNFLKLYHCCILHDDLSFFFWALHLKFNCYDTILYWPLSASSKSVFTGSQFFGKTTPLSSATHFKLSSS